MAALLALPIASPMSVLIAAIPPAACWTRPAQPCHSSLVQVRACSSTASADDACWTSICAEHELPRRGTVRSYDTQGRYQHFYRIAVVSGMDGELFAVEDAVPPLRQRVSGPAAVVDGLTDWVVCQAFGTRFSLRDGERMGPWCPGPPRGTSRWLQSQAYVYTMLLVGAARFWRRSPMLQRPRQLSVFRSRIAGGRLEICLPARTPVAETFYRRWGWLVGRLLLPSEAFATLVPPTTKPLTTASTIGDVENPEEVSVKRQVQRHVLGDPELKLTVVSRPRGSVAVQLPGNPPWFFLRAWQWCQRLLLPSDESRELGRAFVRLPAAGRQHPAMADVVRQVLSRPQLLDNEAHVAVWVSQFVEPEARGHGVDRMLLDEVLSAARDGGYSYVLFIVDDRSPGLYRRLSKYYERQGCVPIPDDNPLGIRRGMLRIVPPDVRTPS